MQVYNVFLAGKKPSGLLAIKGILRMVMLAIVQEGT